MRGKSFTSAVNDVLEPAGFTRAGRATWNRTAGGYRDAISLQTIQSLGTVVNVYTVDLTSKAILDSCAPDQSGGLMYPVYERLGLLMGPFDRAWRQGRDRPSDLAAAIVNHALPFLDRMHDLVQLMGYLSRGAKKWREFTEVVYLAITLYRLGETDQACRLLAHPPRRLGDGGRIKVAALRDYFDCPSMPADLSGPPPM
jgi:hypothetical protein